MNLIKLMEKHNCSISCWTNGGLTIEAKIQSFIDKKKCFTSVAFVPDAILENFNANDVEYSVCEFLELDFEKLIKEESQIKELQDKGNLLNDWVKRACVKELNVSEQSALHCALKETEKLISVVGPSMKFKSFWEVDEAIRSATKLLDAQTYDCEEKEHLIPLNKINVD